LQLDLKNLIQLCVQVGAVSATRQLLPPRGWGESAIDGGGILRVVIHTFEQVDEDLCEIRIISARKATRAEANQYREGDTL